MRALLPSVPHHVGCTSLPVTTCGGKRLTRASSWHCASHGTLGSKLHRSAVQLMHTHVRQKEALDD